MCVARFDQVHSLMGQASKEMTPAAWAPHKLDRIEDLQWDPPELSFITERHGAMVVGESSREEIQSCRQP